MIRNELYIKYFRDISSLSEKLHEALDSLPSCDDEETMEETELRHTLYKAAESLSEAKAAIHHFSKETKEGYLYENSRGRFELHGDEFSCGCDIEVYLNEDPANNIEKGWYAGRVEHTSGKGYYFYGPGKLGLYDGMRVRKRI